MRHIIYKGLSGRRFGVELEVSPNLSKEIIAEKLKEFESNNDIPREVLSTYGKEGWAQTDKNDYWHVKFDRTCGPLGKEFDHGWEIASYIAAGIRDVDNISRAARWLAASGCQTNQNCGLHIHVETIDFGLWDISILMARWLKIEDILFQFCDESRFSNKYCKHLRKRAKSRRIKWQPDAPQNLWESIKPKRLYAQGKEKYFSLNTMGFAIKQSIKNYSRGTVELRMPECILDEIHVRNWIKLIICFVDAAKQTKDVPKNIRKVSDIDEFLFYLGLNDTESETILDDDLLSLKAWVIKKLTKVKETSIAREAIKRLEIIGKI